MNEITEADILQIFEKYGLEPKIYNIKWYQRAFVHASVLSSHKKPFKTKSNERLEFLGDGILDMATKFYLYKRFPKEKEGFMTEKKNSLVKNEVIGKIATEMKLSKWLLISDDAERKNLRFNLKRMGCVFEAFVAAIFLDYNTSLVCSDNGFTTVQTFIENVFEKHVNWEDLIHNDDNYKNKLQILFQKEFNVVPYYKEIRTPSREFRMAVYLCINSCTNVIPLEPMPLKEIKLHMMENNSIFLYLGEGSHKIKKKAEQIASMMALRNLE
jgi:ribonuclease III